MNDRVWKLTRYRYKARFFQFWTELRPSNSPVVLTRFPQLNPTLTNSSSITAVELAMDVSTNRSKSADSSASNSNSGTVIFRLSVNFYTIVITRVRELSRIQCDRRATKMQTVNRWIQVLWNLISTILTHSICPEYSGFLISRPLIQVRFCYFVELAEVVNPHTFIATTFFTPNPHPTHSSVSCALLSFNHLKCRLA